MNFTEFYCEIQYFNFHWKITITLHHSHRNTQQWQVGFMTSLPLWVKRHQKYNVILQVQTLKICQRKKGILYLHVHLNNVVLNCTAFYWILKYLKIHEFYWILNVQVGLLNSQSVTNTVGRQVLSIVKVARQPWMDRPISNNERIIFFSSIY